MRIATATIGTTTATAMVPELLRPPLLLVLPSWRAAVDADDDEEDVAEEVRVFWVGV